MVTATCPTETDLLAFHLGTLPDTVLDAVGDHLETCLDCQVRAQALDRVSDPVLIALRGTDGVVGTARASATDVGGTADLLGAPVSADEIGRLGPYRVLKLLGSGGMGIVFAAEDTRLARMVALKILKPALAADPQSRERFLREARAMAKVGSNPHLVPIFDVGESNGTPYLAMELLEGDPLDRWLREHDRPGVADIVHIGRGVAEGLAVAHARGLVHRDVKPANLWLEAPGGAVKMLDFGLARAAVADVKITHSGVVAGTPAYLAPEQARDGHVDARTDLFSLGCVLYELCTGHPPFEGATVYALMTALATAEPKPLSVLRPDLPPTLTDLIMHLLAKRPENRPASAQAVADRLAAIALTPPRRSRRWWPALAVAAALLAITIALGSVMHVRTSKGVVEIESHDPKVKVIVEKGGEFVTILDPESNQKVELLAGEYHVKLSADTPGFKLSADRFTLIRNGKAIVTVKRLDVDPKVWKAAPPDEPWVRRVAMMAAADQVKEVTERLRALNPGFKGEVKSAIDGDEVRYFEFDADEVRDISPVRALAGLHELNAHGGAGKGRRLTDLGPLKGMKLKRLSIGRTGVADLTPLAGLPLEEFNCKDCPVADLAPLKGPTLRRLICDGTKVRDLAPLAGSKITYLNCGRTPLKDLGPLKGVPLTGLMCDNTDVKDLSPLKGMELTSLNIGVTRVEDISPLAGMKLTFLGFGQAPVKDLTPLKGMKLTTLWANHSRVEDLTPLKGMPLTALWLGTTNATDLAPLAGMPLRDLGFDVPKVKDLTPIRPITTLEIINGAPAAEFWRRHGGKE